MWRTAFALPHTARAQERRRQQSRSDRQRVAVFAAPPRTRQQHHDTERRQKNAREKLTGVHLEDFGFFSGLRAREHVRIMLARFDLTVLIGTWSLDENARASHQ
jgi:hypothetical protein